MITNTIVFTPSFFCKTVAVSYLLPKMVGDSNKETTHIQNTENQSSVEIGGRD